MTEIPQMYSSKMPMPAGAGFCGHKYQIMNENEEFGFSINVLKDNATMMALGSSLIVAALALF